MLARIRNYFERRRRRNLSPLELIDENAKLIEEAWLEIRHHGKLLDEQEAELRHERWTADLDCLRRKWEIQAYIKMMRKGLALRKCELRTMEMELERYRSEVGL